jgi:hypothetical protein
MEVLMGVSEILASVDREIALLKQVRALLTGSATAKKVGRPKRAEAAAVSIATSAVKPARKKKRKLSPEGRKRIAEAVRRRWDAQRKAASLSKK